MAAKGKTTSLEQRAEARAVAKLILDSPEYRASIIKRILAGTLPAPIETMLWHYRYGKPVEQVQVNVADLSTLSTLELAQRTQELLDQLNIITPTPAPEFREGENVFDLTGPPKRETIQ